MSLPFTETFIGTNGTNLHTHNPGWFQSAPGQGNIVILSNSGASSVDQWCSMYWTDDTFNNDQSAEAEIRGELNGVIIRATGSDSTLCCYTAWLFVDGNMYIYRNDNSVAPNVSIAAAVTAVSSGDTVKLWAVGSAIHFSKNGVEVGGSPWTDATYSSGSAGLIINNSAGQMNNLTVANVGGGGQTVKALAALGVG